MKKIFYIIWGIVNFAFSGFLAQPLAEWVKEMLGKADDTDRSWLTAPSYSLLFVIIVIILFILLLILSAVVYKMLPANRRRRNKEKIEKQLRAYNSECFTDLGIRATWEVYPEKYMGNAAFIDNLQLFCYNDGHTPIRMSNGVCPMQGCPNHARRIDLYRLKNQIETNLIMLKEQIENK